MIFDARKFVRRVLAVAQNPVSRLRFLDFASGLGDSAWILYGLVRALKPEVCVEIGSARGKSACYVAMALKQNNQGKLYAIDPHTPTNWNDQDSGDSWPIFQKNIRAAGVTAFVEPIRSSSAAAGATWNRPIDLLFIDGDHSYEGVKADWDIFAKFVRPFGLVVFHDTLWDLQPDAELHRADMGVPRFVEELRNAGYPVVTSNKDYGVSMIQPTVGGGPLQSSGHGSEAKSISQP